MKILVTGCNGFIGSHLCRYLRANRIKVLSHHRGKLLPNSKVDIVIHSGGFSRISESLLHPVKCISDNIYYTINIILYMKKTGSSKIIFLSSPEADSPKNVYGITKYLAETILNIGATMLKYKLLIVRLSNVYGNPNENNRFIEKTIDLAIRNEPLILYAAERRYYFLYITDVVKYIHSLLYFDNKNLISLIAEKTYSIEEIATFICKISKSHSNTYRKPQRWWEKHIYIYKNAKKIPVHKPLESRLISLIKKKSL